MTAVVARAISILGHPMVVLPIAALVLATPRVDRAQLAIMAIGMACFAALVMGWSWWQVRHGRWAHVDASDRSERRTLNRFLLIALVCATIAALLSPMPRAFALGVALSATLVLLAQISARWCKLSLHLAFVFYAACLMWQVDVRAGVATFAFALLVAWSRLVLQRHVLRDVVAGAMAGICAGVAFAWLAPRVGG